MAKNNSTATTANDEIDLDALNAAVPQQSDNDPDAPVGDESFANLFTIPDDEEDEGTQEYRVAPDGVYLVSIAKSVSQKSKKSGAPQKRLTMEIIQRNDGDTTYAGTRYTEFWTFTEKAQRINDAKLRAFQIRPSGRGLADSDLEGARAWAQIKTESYPRTDIDDNGQEVTLEGKRNVGDRYRRANANIETKELA